MDMHLKSSMGFTEEDVNSLRSQEDIACVSPSYSVDAFVQPAEGDPMLVRAWSWENGARNKRTPSICRCSRKAAGRKRETNAWWSTGCIPARASK